MFIVLYFPIIGNSDIKLKISVPIPISWKIKSTTMLIRSSVSERSLAFAKGFWNKK